MADDLPLARQGYFGENVLRMLLYVYTKRSGILQENYVVSDDLMNFVFGGNIPCINYIVDRTVIPMRDAIDRGLVDGPLNTYQVLQKLYPDKFLYDGAQVTFHFTCFEQIAALNIYTQKYLRDEYPEIFMNTNQNNVKVDVLREQRIVNTIYINSLLNRSSLRTKPSRRFGQ